MYTQALIVLALASQALCIILSGSILGTLGTVGLKAVAGIGLLKLAGKVLNGGSQHGGYGSSYGDYGLGGGYGDYGFGGGYGHDGGYGGYPRVYHHQVKSKNTYVQQAPRVVHRPIPVPVPHPVAVPVPHPVAVPVPQPIAVPQLIPVQVPQLKNKYQQPPPVFQPQLKNKYSQQAPIFRQPELKNKYPQQAPVVHSPRKIVQQGLPQQRRRRDADMVDADLESLFQEIEKTNAEQCLQLVTCEVMLKKEKYSFLYESVNAILEKATTGLAIVYTDAAKLGVEAEKAKDMDACRKMYECSTNFQDLMSAAEKVYNL